MLWSLRKREYDMGKNINKIKQIAALASAINPDAEVEISSLIRPAGVGYKQHVIKCTSKKRSKKKGKR